MPTRGRSESIGGLPCRLPRKARFKERCQVRLAKEWEPNLAPKPPVQGRRIYPANPIVRLSAGNRELRDAPHTRLAPTGSNPRPRRTRRTQLHQPAERRSPEVSRHAPNATIHRESLCQSLPPARSFRAPSHSARRAVPRRPCSHHRCWSSKLRG